jgi:hypothetical protein
MAGFAYQSVSSTGDDANDCATVATACHWFQRAHDQTFSGGQIVCVDSLDSGGSILTKSITIECAGTSATTSFFIAFVNRSTITGNDTGWTATGGGNLVTEGPNSVYLNLTSNGAPSASIGLQ